MDPVPWRRIEVAVDTMLADGHGPCHSFARHPEEEQKKRVKEAFVIKKRSHHVYQNGARYVQGDAGGFENAR